MTKRVDVNAGALAVRRGGKTQAEIARLCGVSRTIVSDWWHGRKVPGPEHRARLEALGLVKAEQWDQSSRQKPRAAPATPPPPAQVASGPLDPRQMLLDQANRLRGRLNDDELTSSAAVNIERALGQALSSIAKIDGADISESMILRSPAFRRVMAVLTTVRVEALQANATAAELVRMEADALAQLVGG